MTILNMTYCVRCGKHHATTKGCNVDDVRKHKKEMEKYRAKGKLVEDPNDVTQKDIDDILRKEGDIK